MQNTTNKADDKLLEAIYESDVELFKEALKEGANINGVVSEEQDEEFDFQEGESYLSTALDIALSPLAYIPYDKKGNDKQKYESNHAKAFEILNALKALNPDESKADFKAKDRLESILETRDMELYDDPAVYGYADFEEEMSEEEWISEDPIKEYLESFEKSLES